MTLEEDLSYTDSYQAYAEGAVYSGNPVRLVVALYEGALEAVKSARECLTVKDIMGRCQKINKAHRIISELLISLDHERGGEISANLQRLYGYMQVRLLDANLQQSEEPLLETERLLSDLLEAWRAVADKTECQEVPSRAVWQEVSAAAPVAENCDNYRFLMGEPALTSSICAAF